MSSTDPVTGTSPSPPRPRGWRRRLLQTFAWSIAALASLLLLASLILHWGILNHIERWRGQIEHGASQALGVVVRIGHIEVRPQRWLPSVELRDVVLLDARGNQALRLPRASASLAASSLLAFELRFDQLVLDGIDLEVRRDAAGRIKVAGIDVGGEGAGAKPGGFSAWFFDQHEVVVRGGSLSFVDETRDAPALALGNVDLAYRHGLRDHTLRLEATPPARWGERFSAEARFTRPLLAASGDWSRWSGTASVELPRADLRELPRHLDLPFELIEGEGGVRAALRIEEGAPRELTLDLALRAVSLRLARDLQPLSLEQVEGRLSAERDDAGVRLAAEHFGFVTREGLRWPRSNAQLAWQQRQHAATAQAVTGGTFSAGQLDLALLSAIAGRLPLGDAMHRLLASFDAAGKVSGLAAEWSGPLDAPASYRVEAKVAGLSLAARPTKTSGAIGRPGIARADVDFKLTESGGDARITLAKGAIDLPGVFEEALLPLERLSARVSWSVVGAKRAGAPPRIEVQARDVSVANADLQASFNAVWRTGAGSGVARGGRFPGWLDLNGTITKGQATRVARYLPLALPEGVRRYVERAVQAGTIGTASVSVKGDLWDFPFHAAQPGEFRIVAQVDDAVFAYVPSTPASPKEAAFRSPWPPLTQVGVQLTFDRAAMRVHNGRARIAGIELARVHGGIDNLVQQPLLALDGNGSGKLADALAFVNRTPVGTWTGHALDPIRAAGNGELRLQLGIALADLDRSTVSGSVTLAGNDVRVRPGTPLLAAARGRIDFSQRGFSIVGASAQVAGGQAQFEGGLGADGSLRFAGQGTASAEGLRQSAELGFLSRIAASLSGQTQYRMTLGFVDGVPEVMVSSNLVGIAAELPAPLGKAAGASLPLRYETRVLPRAGKQGVHDRLRFELGSLVQAEYLRDVSGDAARVLSGGIGINAPAPQPASGVAANVSLDALNFDAWSALGEKHAEHGEPAETSDADAGPGYVPARIALRTNALQVGGRRLTRVVAGVSHDAHGWRANVACDQLDGHIDYRAPRLTRRGSAGRVYARLVRLALPKGDDEGVENLLEAQPARVPALDIVIDDFELRGKRLGRVEIEATNRASVEAGEPGREWRLSRLALTTPEATLAATGQWAMADAGGQRRASMDFTLDLADSGAFLARLGFGESIRGGKGRLAGKVAWIGSPLSPDVASMDGALNLALDQGQFLKAEPGVARILGVLSLQSLPRRLALDFRDVFADGFAFDNVTGDVKIAGGVASTNNLRMRGVQAAVLMEGQADIRRETQNLRVLVVPRINAGTASLAYAVINPVVGLGTFLAQLVLREPLMLAGTREFQVSGSWSDPNVERVQRKLGAPLPDLDAQAPAAPTPTQR